MPAAEATSCPEREAAGGELNARLRAALDYLEAHLDSPVRLETIARLAGFSPWHFIRVFQGSRGVPPLEYVRRRRLTRAAIALAAGEPVIQVAMQWGYGSQAAFTRAFSRTFGIPPGTYRRQAQRGEAAALALTLPHDPEAPWPIAPAPAPRYVERGPSRWVGRCMPASGAGNQLPADPSAFWEDWLRNSRWRAVEGIDPVDRGHSLIRPRQDGSLEYYIAVEAPPGAGVPAGFQAVPLGGRPVDAPRVPDVSADPRPQSR